MIRLELWLTLTSGEKRRAAELVFGNADQQGRYAQVAHAHALPDADIARFAHDIEQRLRRA